MIEFETNKYQLFPIPSQALPKTVAITGNIKPPTPGIKFSPPDMTEQIPCTFLPSLKSL